MKPKIHPKSQRASKIQCMQAFIVSNEILEALKKFQFGNYSKNNLEVLIFCNKTGKNEEMIYIAGRGQNYHYLQMMTFTEMAPENQLASYLNNKPIK